jgi:hypothetical protein
MLMRTGVGLHVSLAAPVAERYFRCLVDTAVHRVCVQLCFIESEGYSNSCECL